MSVLFPSLEFFESLRAQLSADPECSKIVGPSEAYCGFAIGDSLYVVEGSVGSDPILERLIDEGAIEIRFEVDDGPELARAALGFVQLFFDQARHFEVKFA